MTRRWLRRLHWMARSLIILGIVGFATGFVLTRTGPGYRLVIRLALDRANRALPGTISVGSVSSSGILGGALLRDVEFVDSLGGPFVAADSIQARYSILPLVGGQLALGPIRVWGARVHVEKLSEEEGLNVWRAVGDRSSGPSPRDSVPPLPDSTVSAPDSARGGGSFLRSIVISGVEVIDSEVTVRLAAPESGTPTIGRIVTTEEGRRVRQLRISDVDARVPSAVIRSPGQEGEAFQVGTLVADADVLSLPLRIEEFRGAVRRVGSTVSVVTPRIWLTETEASGEAMVDWSDREFIEASVDLTADVFDTDDLRWLPISLPDATGSTRVVLERSAGGLTVELTDLGVNFDRGGSASGRLGFETSGEFLLRGVDLDLRGVDTGLLGVWMEESPVPPARVSGPVRVSGPLRALQVDARLRVEDPEGELLPTTGEVAGVIHSGEALGFTGLSVRADSLDYGWASRFDPRVPFKGFGSLDLTGSGTFGQGMAVSGALTYDAGAARPTSLRVDGTLAGWGPDGIVDADLDLQPLSLEGVAEEFQGVPLRGVVSGPLLLRGPLRALTVRGDLTVGGAESPDPLSVEAELNVLDPGAGYAALLSTPGLHLDSLVTFAPTDSRVTGSAGFAGSGLSGETLAGEGHLQLDASNLGQIRMDTLYVGASLGEGRLTADTVIIGTSAGNAVGSGALGITESSAPGRIELAITASSLSGLRPFFKGEEVVARDTLTPIQREALEMAGVNPDTLPLLVDVEVDGSAAGDLVLEGTLADFSAAAELAVVDAKYGTNLVDSAFVDFRVDGLPATDGRLVGRIDATSIYIRRKTFRTGSIELDFQSPRGVGAVRLERDRDEDYLARGTIELSDSATAIFLDQVTMRFGEDQWNLGGPASFVVTGESLIVRDLSLLRQGEGGMRMEAGGVLTRAGPADFDFTATGLDLARMASLVQLEQDLAGVVDARLSVTGTGAAPVVEGSLSGVGLRVETIRFDTLVASLSAAEDRLRATVNAWTEGTPSLTIAADLPIVLSPDAGDRDLSEEPLDLQAAFTRYPARSVLGFVDSVEGVEGHLNGSVTFGGTLNNLRTGGTVVLEDGALSLPALGVRYTRIDATAELGADRVANVTGSLHSGGSARVAGTIQLDSVSNPAFDLTIDADRLTAVQRRDLSGTLSGQAHLTGRFQAPRVTGSIRVTEGELSLEEFVRSASVVDVSDPSLEFGDLLREELTGIRPVLIQTQNPFMANLNMDVTLSMSGGTWIRSRELDVEMSGDLSLLWDRQNNSLVMAGGLSALRGAYNNFGRRFQVVSGDVGFAGTPDLNPTLSIQTETRIRTTRGEPMTIVATVEGTLLEPRVSLSSTFQPPIAESDLVSYLLFGQPSYGLAEGSSAAASAGGLLLGVLSSQIGSQLAQGIPFLDYVSVTARPEGREGAAAVAANDAVLDTSVEGGLYVFDDVFLGFRVPINTSPNQNRQPDAWVELTVFDPLRIEAFYQDRFARDNLSGLGNLSFSTDKMWGFLLYREWGF